jgi:hypothetical protein
MGRLVVVVLVLLLVLLLGLVVLSALVRPMCRGMKGSAASGTPRPTGGS